MISRELWADEIFSSYKISRQFMYYLKLSEALRALADGGVGTLGSDD